MKINKISADSFGKLKNKQITLSDGINVITGQNESGKSSVARFIRFMLFGFTGRGTDILKNDKKKFMPWDENSVKGSMEISEENQEYVIRREQSSRSTQSITKKDGEPVFKGLEAGEAFWKISAETFDKTALISSGDVYFDDTASLSTAIKNMVFAADGEIDSDNAIKKLESFSTKILGKAERSGKLFELRKELAELIDKKTALTELHKELIGAEASLERIKNNIAQKKIEKEKLEREKENIEAFLALEMCKKIDAAREKYQNSKNEYENKLFEITVSGFTPTRDFLSEINESLLLYKSKEAQEAGAKKELAFAKDSMNSVYGQNKQFKFNETLDKSEKTPEDIKTDIETLKNSYAKFKKLAIIFLVLILTFPISIFLFLKCSKIKNQLDKLVLTFDCTSLSEFEYMLSEYHSSNQAVNNAKMRLMDAEAALENATSQKDDALKILCNLLEKSGDAVSDASDIALIAKHRINYLSLEIEKAENLENEMNVDKASLESILQSVSEEELRQKANTYNSDIPIRDQKKNATDIDFYTGAIETLLVQERNYEKKAAVISSNMEKPDELAAKINSLSKTISALELEHAAANMAKDAIVSSHESVKGNVSPILTKEASDMFNIMTDGKYEGLFVDKNLGLTFLEKGSSVYRSIEYLSTGALDAAYLCLRITLTKHLYETKPILIFDDAFSKFDNSRLENISKLLNDLSKQYQIIVLTCHTREEKLLKGNIIKF